MTDKEERRIVTFSQWMQKSLYPNKALWNELPLAPKHTDKEYYELLKLWEAQAITIASMLHHEDKYKSRIKELEAILETKQNIERCPACGWKPTGSWVVYDIRLAELIKREKALSAQPSSSQSHE
jgi:hypothetical protein